MANKAVANDSLLRKAASKRRRAGAPGAGMDRQDIKPSHRQPGAATATVKEQKANGVAVMFNRPSCFFHLPSNFPAIFTLLQNAEDHYQEERLTAQYLWHNHRRKEP